MALNANYGFPPSGYSSPYSSTPTGIRTQRPRFGYSGPSMYPRSRTPASDTESFSDSMVNNYGTSTSRFDTTFNSGNRSSFNDSYNTSSSNYYSANNTFSHGKSYGETSMMHSDYSLRENGGLSRDNSMIPEGQNMRGGYSRDNSMMPEGQNMRGGYSGSYSGIRALPRSDTSNSGFLSKGISQFDAGIRALPRSDASNSGFLSKGISQFDASNYNYNTTFGMNNAAEFKGNFQKKSYTGVRNNKPYFARKQGKQPKMAGTKQSAWKCGLCSIEFTSQIPYDMHLRGAKHAKKIKANLALKSVLEAEKAANTITSQDDKKTFFCELCNVKANSSLQLQTHLEGTKHKSKLQPKETSLQSETPEDSKDSTKTSVNGKTNGSLVRPLPSDFGEPQPSKLVKYACEVCNVAVNSEVQLQQHLTSKKHQNKVEGKPVTKGKKVRKNSESITESTPVTEKAEETPMEQVSNETSTKVVGVKTLASSFVQGETLQ